VAHLIREGERVAFDDMGYAFENVFRPYLVLWIAL